MPFSQTDTFETDLGNWENDTGDDFDWSQSSGTTPSSGTGPGGGQSSTFYVYTETSAPVANSDEAILLLSNSIDASLYALEVDFAEHMVGMGDGTGFLAMEVWDGDSWNEEYRQTGDNGATEDGTDYVDRNVDISSYTNTDLLVRFILHVSNGGNSYQNDAALDNIVISGPDRASLDQSGFLYREDDDDEADATARGQENEHLTHGMVVAGSGWVQSPDHADYVSFANDIDIKLYLVADDLTPGSNECVFQIRNSSGSNEYISIFILTDGRIGYFWSDGGSEQSMFSSSAIPLAGGSIGISVYHDQDNGASQNQAFFGYSRDGVNFTALGSDTIAGASDIFSGASSAIAYAGRRVDGFGFNGKIHWASIADDGGLIDYLEMSDGGQGWETGDVASATGVSSGGHTWTLNDDAVIQGGLNVEDVIRIRVQINASGNPPAVPFEYRYRWVSEPQSEDRPI